jgi:hypothetical protein
MGARATSVTVGSQASSATIPINWGAVNFGIGFGCVISAGAGLTYKVEHTFDNVFSSAVTPTWFDHASVVAKTASADGNYAYPIRAVRLTVTAWTSGNVTLTLLQGD